MEQFHKPSGTKAKLSSTVPIVEAKIRSFFTPYPKFGNEKQYPVKNDGVEFSILENPSHLTFSPLNPVDFSKWMSDKSQWRDPRVGGEFSHH